MLKLAEADGKNPWGISSCWPFTEKQTEENPEAEFMNVQFRWGFLA